MSIKNVFNLVERIKCAIQENVQAEKDLDVFNDEHWDVLEEKRQLEKRTEDSEEKAHNLTEEFDELFTDFDKLEAVSDDIDWLKLPLIVGRNFYDKENDSRYKDIVKSDQFYFATNGKMIFYVKPDQEIEDTIQLPESQMQIFNDYYVGEYPTFETFDLSKIEESHYGICYTTDSDTKIYFTTEFLYTTLMMGEDVTIYYSRTKPELPLFFRSGNRRAALMPKLQPKN